MIITSKERIYWALILLASLAFLYLTKAILLPFLAGLAVAYFLDPVADMLEERKVPRGAAAAFVLVGFFLFAAGIALAFVPILQDQFATLSKILPKALAELRPWLNSQIEVLSDRFGLSLGGDIDSILAQAADAGMAHVQSAVSSVVQGGLAFFNIFSLLLITPVVGFYLLRDWDQLVARVDTLLPYQLAPRLRVIASEVNTVLAGFVRGQMLVSLCMSVLYAVGWSLTGLNFGLVLGVLAGILGFIPFVGALFGFLMALVIAVTQWGLDPINLGLVGLVYLIVQTLEGAVLTPRLVGDRVGLHPVWVLFAVFAGGEILGFVGVLIAVPFAAAFAVLVRHAIDDYSKSNKSQLVPAAAAIGSNGQETKQNTVDTEGGAE